MSVRITWLGHATFLLRAESGFTVLVDPFVDSNPACPKALHDPGRVDVIAISHGHGDHLKDVAAVAQRARPQAIVSIVEVAGWLQGLDLDGDAVIGMNKGGTVRVGEVAITMTDANHSSGIPDGDSERYGGEAAGLVFTFDDGTRIYHAGDTNVFGDMALIGELYSPQVALLPIGDHYTMGPREAAKACELLGAPHVIPMHWGTFPVLTGRPEALASECEARGVDVEVVSLQPGGSWP